MPALCRCRLRAALFYSHWELYSIGGEDFFAGAAGCCGVWALLDLTLHCLCFFAVPFFVAPLSVGCAYAVLLK